MVFKNIGPKIGQYTNCGALYGMQKKDECCSEVALKYDLLHSNHCPMISTSNDMYCPFLVLTVCYQQISFVSFYFVFNF